MKYNILLIISLITLKSYSQELTGQIYNSEDKKPISFVNIGVIGKNTGTISDINGKFSLILAPRLNSDSLRISCIGFHSISYLVRDLIDVSSSKPLVKIGLKPASYKISEVQVEGYEPKLRTLGNPIKDNHNIIQTDSLKGAETGLVIQVPKKNRNYKLKSFTFSLYDHHFEREVRLNVYNLVDSKPSEIILQQPIYFTIPSDKDILTIDLDDYNIFVDDDFFISIENFKGNPSMDKRLKYNGVWRREKSVSYCRPVSQGKWVQIPVASVQFKVIVYEYPK